MKMSYPQDNLKRQKKIRLYALVVILGIVFLFTSGLILTKGYDLLSYVAIPLWRFEFLIRGNLSDFKSILMSKRSLEAVNEKLQTELDNIKIQLLSMNAVEQENSALMIEMGREVPTNASSTITRVLSGPNIPPYDSLIIDAGRNEGVSVGDRVISEPNIMLGEVVQVSGYSAKVRLYSAYGSRTDVLIPAGEPLHAVAYGYGGGDFYIELPDIISIEKDMEVLIPGRNNYILGTVGYIEADPNISSQKILVRYPVNIKNIRYVHVLKMLTNEYIR